MPVPRRTHARVSWRGRKPTVYTEVTAALEIGFNVQLTVEASIVINFNIGPGVQSNLVRLAGAPWSSTY